MRKTEVLAVIPGREPKVREPGIQKSAEAMYFVYLLTNKRNGTLYLGVTNDLIRRVYEHKQKAVPGFSSRYDTCQLVWFEAHDDVNAAISREKEIKKWKRAWKLALIEKNNSDWIDLYDDICR